MTAKGTQLEVFKKTSDLFDDLFAQVTAAIRTEWKAEVKQIETSLNDLKSELGWEILTMITPGDLGRALWKHALEIRGFAGKEFSSVTTELPAAERRPPNVETYKRPEGSEVLISARVATEAEVLAESLDFAGLLTGNYTPVEQPKPVETITVRNSLSVSLKGTVQKQGIGNFKV